MATQAVLDLIANLKDNASAGMASIGDAAGKMGLVAGGVALAGVAALGVAVARGVGDAREAAGLYAQTTAVIKSTGDASGATAKQVVDLATALSAASGKSLFGDAQIQQSTNMLLTFTNIKGTVLDAATAIGVDMAQAMGGAPVDQAIRLGKALNDPIAGMGALAKVGVTFTQEQKDQIKTMQDAGDMAGAQGVILAELTKEYGGSAQAAADADGGFAQFTDRMGEAGEKIGAALLPVLGLLAGFLLDDVVPAVEYVAQAFSDWVSDPAVQAGIEALASAIGQTLGDAMAFVSDTVIPALMDAWDYIAPAVDAVLPLFDRDLPDALGTAGDTFTMIGGLIDGIMTAIADVVGAELAIVLAFWQQNGDDIMAFVGTTWDTVISIIDTALQIIMGIVGPMLADLAQFWRDNGDQIVTILGATWDLVASIMSGALQLIQGVLTVALDLINGDWTKAWGDLQTTCATVLLAIGDVIVKALDLIASFFGTSLEGIAKLWTDNWNSFIEIIGKIDWVAAGQSVVEGIVAGVQGWVGNLVKVMEGMAQKAYDSFMTKIAGGSPAEMFIPTGESIVLGIMQGLIDTMPDLEASMAGLGDKLIKQATDIARAAQTALGAAYAGEASIDRIAAANLDKYKDVLPTFLQYTQGAISQVKAEADSMLDPAAGAKWFRMRSDQIFEFAKLQKAMTVAATQDDRDRITAQMNLITQAQTAEIAAFQAIQAGAVGPLQAMATKISGLIASISSSGVLTPEQFATVQQLSGLYDMLTGAQKRAGGGPVEPGAAYWVGEQGPELFLPNQAGQVAANGASVGATVNNYYRMSYETRQSVGSVAQDIRILSLLHG